MNTICKFALLGTAAADLVETQPHGEGRHALRRAKQEVFAGENTDPAETTAQVPGDAMGQSQFPDGAFDEFTPRSLTPMEEFAQAVEDKNSLGIKSFVYNHPEKFSMTKEDLHHFDTFDFSHIDMTNTTTVMAGIHSEVVSIHNAQQATFQNEVQQYHQEVLDDHRDHLGDLRQAWQDYVDDYVHHHNGALNEDMAALEEKLIDAKRNLDSVKQQYADAKSRYDTHHQSLQDAKNEINVWKQRALDDGREFFDNSQNFLNATKDDTVARLAALVQEVNAKSQVLEAARATLLADQRAHAQTTEKFIFAENLKNRQDIIVEQAKQKLAILDFQLHSLDDTAHQWKGQSEIASKRAAESQAHFDEAKKQLAHARDHVTSLTARSLLQHGDELPADFAELFNDILSGSTNPLDEYEYARPLTDHLDSVQNQVAGVINNFNNDDLLTSSVTLGQNGQFFGEFASDVNLADAVPQVIAQA